jgi:hypothetical protein
MRPSVWIAVACVAGTARAGHFDDVIDHHAARPPPPCQPRPDDIVPRCPTQVAASGDVTDDDSPPQPEDFDARLARASARAEIDRETPSPPPRDAEPPPVIVDDDLVHWQGDLALGYGNAVVDGADVDSYPSVAIGGGVRRGRWTALARYTLSAEHYHAPVVDQAAMGPPPPFQDTDGLVHKLGLVGRFSFLHGSTDEGLLGDLWLQGDGGEEFTRWDRGGLLARPYVGFGLGFQGGIQSANGRRHSAYLALRVQLARRSDLANAAATCSAPCTEATPPERWSDRSLGLEVGFAWGD